MHAIRFFLLVAVGYITSFGYAAMLHRWPPSESVWRLMIAAATLAFVVSAASLLLSTLYRIRERLFVVTATAFGYVAVVLTVLYLQARPDVYSPLAWWLLVGFLSAPFLAATCILSQAKYEEACVTIR